MSLIAFTSAKGAPGTSTAALALTTCWPGPVLLAECDPAGGDLATGWFHGAADRDGRGLLSLSSSLRRGGGTVREQVLMLDDTAERVWLPGLTDPAQAATVAAEWPRLAEALTTMPGDGGWDVLADLGRLGTTHFATPLLQRAALVVVVVRGVLRSLAAARPWLRRLAAERGDVGVLVVGDGAPYHTSEVAEALGVDALGVLPTDAPSAAWLNGEGPRPRRSPLLTAAAGTAVDLRRRLDRAPTPRRVEVSA